MNQHSSRKRDLLRLLGYARAYLRVGYMKAARRKLVEFWRVHAKAPASTRRRWKCGQ